MPRHLNDGSVLHPRHERKRSTGGGMVQGVSVSTGGYASAAPAEPKSRGPSVFEARPGRGGVTVSRMDEGGEGPLTKAGRFRIG